MCISRHRSIVGFARQNLQYILSMINAKEDRIVVNNNLCLFKYIPYLEMCMHTKQ
jgi:hypothetical protein